jgi:hypothetical protein
MKDPTILGRLEHDLAAVGAELTHPGQVAAWLNQHIHPTRYHAPSSNPEGHPAMTLDEFKTDLQNGAQDLIGKAEDFLGAAKTFAEQHVGLVSEIQQSPVAQAIEGFVLPPDVEAELTSLVKTYVARFGTPAVAPAAPVVDEPPAAAPVAAGPTVAGTAG